MQAIADQDFAMDLIREKVEISDELIDRFSIHLPDEDRKSVSQYISTIDNILTGIFLTYYLLIRQSKEQCLEQLRIAVSNLRRP